MFITTEFRRTVDEARAALADPKPLHAMAGAGDLIVERVRTAVMAQQKTLQSVRFEPSAVQAFLSSTKDNVRGAVTRFPDRAQDVVIGSVVQATTTYDDLAKRGAGLVRRISRQRATQNLAEQVDNTVRAAKATSTTARKATETTGSRVKATVTSARNTASAAGAAASAAAGKTGTTTTTATRQPATAAKRTSPTAKRTSPTAKRTSPTAKKAARTTKKAPGGTAKKAAGTTKRVSTPAKKASPKA